MTDAKLFRVCSNVKHFHDCEDVKISWFVHSRKAPLHPYATLVIGYENATESVRREARTYVDECFAESEALALFAYLKVRHGAADSDLEISPARLPIPCNVTSLSQMRFGRVDVLGHHWLSSEPDYSLPFKVGGVYDARFSKRLMGALAYSEEDEIPF